MNHVSALGPSHRTRRVLFSLFATVILMLGFTAAFAPRAEAIVGGRAASQAYPNMAAFLYDGDQICGASLVAPQWVMSAAHCVDNKNPSHYSFRIGGVADLDGAGGETLRATSVIVHPDYESTHDVALFQLERPSTFAPIAIANPSTQRHLWETGDTARVIGYGGPFFQLPSLDNRLMEVDVPIVDDAECDASYAFTFGGIDESVEVCAGELHGTKDSCQGDSGGPLMVPDEAGTYVQVGVVSWGFGCALPTQYGVYSRVADTTLYNWIQSII